MSVLEITALCLLGLFLLAAVWRLFKTPLKLVLRVGLNTLLGFAAMWLWNALAGEAVFPLPLSLFNGLTVGVLGLPGFGLLLGLTWVLGT